MTDIEKTLAAWKVAQRFLERERADRLQNMTDSDTRNAIATLFADTVVASDHAVTEDVPTGLIEQQRLFRLVSWTRP